MHEPVIRPAPPRATRALPALLLSLLAAAVGGVACGDRHETSVTSTAARELGVGCVDGWDPGWRQGQGANAWWVEYYVDAPDVVSVALVTDGGHEVALARPWSKWVAEPGFAIARGTDVVLRATSASGEQAATVPFAYLDEDAPVTRCPGACVPSCEGRACGDDRCGGSCGSCGDGERCDEGSCAAPPVEEPPPESRCDDDFAPTLTQGSGANPWWIEYRFEGADVAAAAVEVEGRGLVALAPHYSKWAAAAGERLDAGTLVVLRLTSTDGRSASSVPFAYLEETAPPLAPCADDGEGECPPLEGMVTLQFDDNSATQYTLARPALLERGLVGELVLVVQPFVAGWSGYLSVPEARAFVDDGGAIVAHGMEHVPLSRLSVDEIRRQLEESRAWLEAHLETSVPHYAAPDGEADEDGREIARTSYASYRAARGGLNLPGVDPYFIESDVVHRFTAPSEVLAWVADAQERRGWRVLVFHRFTTGTPDERFPPQYNVSAFEEILDGIVASGVAVVTTEEALERLRCHAECCLAE